MVMVFNTTFNNVSVISWWSVLLVGETKVQSLMSMSFLTNLGKGLKNQGRYGQWKDRFFYCLNSRYCTCMPCLISASKLISLDFILQNKLFQSLVLSMKVADDTQQISWGKVQIILHMRIFRYMFLNKKIKSTLEIRCD